VTAGDGAGRHGTTIAYFGTIELRERFIDEMMLCDVLLPMIPFYSTNYTPK
jgi:hypothetical protein